METSSSPTNQASEVADTVARQSYGKLLAYLAVRTRDVAAAEDALSEAFAAALADWPRKGCPENPEAWLLAVARRKIVDAIRVRERDERLRQVAANLETVAAEMPDERLALMFACAHPALEPGVRAPLILQSVLGLTAKTIASAFLTSPEAMGKRLVRAKEKIRQTGIPFRVPEREELPERLSHVLEAIYAAFTEGWTDLGRGDLAEEAIFLAWLLTELLPEEPEALGLLALMLYAEARREARRQDGEYVPLEEQNPDRWDSAMIHKAEDLLRHAQPQGRVGRYQLEAALQSAHVSRIRTGRDNWAEVLQLYDALLALTGSPVVAINRALAVAEIEGPQAGLASMPELTEYQPYWAARAQLLAKLGDSDAHHAYEIAIGLERDPAVRRFLLRRQSAVR